MMLHDTYMTYHMYCVCTHVYTRILPCIMYVYIHIYYTLYTYQFIIAMQLLYIIQPYTYVHVYVPSQHLSSKSNAMCIVDINTDAVE